jgi:hypothetical protein
MREFAIEAVCYWERLTGYLPGLPLQCGIELFDANRALQTLAFQDAMKLSRAQLRSTLRGILIGARDRCPWRRDFEETIDKLRQETGCKIDVGLHDYPTFVGLGVSHGDPFWQFFQSAEQLDEDGLLRRISTFAAKDVLKLVERNPQWDRLRPKGKKVDCLLRRIFKVRERIAHQEAKWFRAIGMEIEDVSDVEEPLSAIALKICRRPEFRRLLKGAYRRDRFDYGDLRKFMEYSGSRIPTYFKRLCPFKLRTRWGGLVKSFSFAGHRQIKVKRLARL